MQSKLINTIFSVEKEAENIVADAREKGGLILASIQQEGEELVRKAAEEAREERLRRVAEAQKASHERIKRLQAEMERENTVDENLQECAQRIADRMVTLLCSSGIQEA